ncbi:hypothetical protein I4U23_014540 [Adineta vaga]|nr:hypothetical protein I4U23_014540 [Adineta vaga]
MTKTTSGEQFVMSSVNNEVGHRTQNGSFDHIHVDTQVSILLLSTENKNDLRTPPENDSGSGRSIYKGYTECHACLWLRKVDAM